MSLNLGVYLVDQGAITPQQFTAAVKESLKRKTPIGELAMREHKLRMNQVYEILRLQADRKASFGRLAIEAGYLNRTQLAELLYIQAEEEPPIGQILVEQGAILPRDLETHRRNLQTQISNRPRRNALGDALVSWSHQDDEELNAIRD